MINNFCRKENKKKLKLYQQFMLFVTHFSSVLSAIPRNLAEIYWSFSFTKNTEKKSSRKCVEMSKITTKDDVRRVHLWLMRWTVGPEAKNTVSDIFFECVSRKKHKTPKSNRQSSIDTRQSSKEELERTAARILHVFCRRRRRFSRKLKRLTREWQILAFSGSRKSIAASR